MTGTCLVRVLVFVPPALGLSALRTLSWLFRVGVVSVLRPARPKCCLSKSQLKVDRLLGLCLALLEKRSASFPTDGCDLFGGYEPNLRVGAQRTSRTNRQELLLFLFPWRSLFSSSRTSSRRQDPILTQSKFTPTSSFVSSSSIAVVLFFVFTLVKSVQF